MDENKWLDLYLADMREQFHLELNQEVLTELKRHPRGIKLRYLVDFALSHLLFGTLVIAFWRGTWDFAIEIFEGVREFQRKTNAALHWLYWAPLHY